MIVYLLSTWIAIGNPAVVQDNSECLECHATPGLKLERDGREISLFVDMERYAQSVHARQKCVNCHQDLTGVEKYPHSKEVERVDCTECHDDDDGPIAAFWDSTHGQKLDEEIAEAPHCQDCHGEHYILPLDDPDSAVSPFNIPQMCAQCHAEGAPVARAHDLSQEQIVQRYKQSIHGEGLFKQGLLVTAVCTSCHTGHNVLPHDDERSSIHKNNVVGTCMKCHGRIEDVHRKIIAGELWEQEGVVPICIECHSPHEIREVDYNTNMRTADCLHCHRTADLKAADDGRSLYVDADEYRQSIHGREVISCPECHTGASPADSERPCKPITGRVDCSLCHEAQVSAYDLGRHGQLHAKGDPNAPYCTDCHGRHGMLEHTADEAADPIARARVRESPTYSRNIPTLCARCHREGGAAAVRYLGNETQIVSHYAMSIHGKGLIESGLTVTATCTNCHTAHMELPASDPNSSVSESNIGQTCGRCHDGIYDQYRRSIHSSEGNPDYERLRGMSALPHCNDCHSSHTVKRTDMPDFQLGIMEQCGKCHEELTRSYFDTYHGKASDLGDTTRAKCHDCHGAHDILPVDDARSNLHRDNIVATCGKCHEGSHRRFAGYLTHATHHDQEKYPILFYTFWGMTALLVGTFGLFGLHTIAWLPRAWKMRTEHRAAAASVGANGRQFVRFTRFQRGLHLTVILSFFGLAITGMMLKFAYTEWAQILIRLFGGVESAGWIHRVCAIATFGYFFLHICDVIRRFRRGDKTLRQFLFGPDSLLPQPIDVREFGATLKWFLGRGPRPNYGRWTYWEKFDYFAVFWGVVIIGATGLCLWFPELFTRLLPGWSVNVATIIHSDEALLATGFIFTVHFFNTHFRPDKFPMDTVVFTGSMSVDELRRDKPRLYDELKQRGELERHLGPAPSLSFTRTVKIFGFGALLVGTTLVVLIVYAMLVTYR